MADFKFLKNTLTKRWVISAPRRASRPNSAEAPLGKPDIAEKKVPICPFCSNHEKAIYQIPSSKLQVPKTVIANEVKQSQDDDQWAVKVVNNKYPFAPIHEIVIHSPEHTKNFEKLPIRHISQILTAYRERYNEHSRHGQVYIFHNRGKKAGESLPHPHTQITVIPDEVYLDLPPLRSVIPDTNRHSRHDRESSHSSSEGRDPRFPSKGGQARDDKGRAQNDSLETDHFIIFCPETSEWPDEVWIAPKRADTEFGEITDDEKDDLAHVLFSLLTIFDLRYDHDFPFNFYIYPGKHWYLRIIPRKKTLGGFEVGTGVMVNTQKPSETMEFIKTHFHQPDIIQIMREHRADYHKRV